MPKLTDRTAISTNIDEDLLIHVVDETTTATSFKATLSQLYGVFPKNSSAGAGDVNYLARWTSANELGKGIIQDNGSNATVNGELKVKNTATAQIRILRDGEGLIYFSSADGLTDHGYIGQSSGNTYMRFLQGGNTAIEIDNSRNVDFKGAIQIRQTGGTTPEAGQYLKAINGQGQAEWADSEVKVSGTPANNQIAVWTADDTIEGDSNLTWNQSTLEVTSGNNESRILADYLYNLNESDDANLLLYTKAAGTSIGSEIVFGRWDGTVGSELPLKVNQLISAQRIMGSYDTANPTNITTGALIECRASENWSTSAKGVIYTIDTFASGEFGSTPTERFRIHSDGGVRIAKNLQVSGQAYSTIQSTTYTPTGIFTIDFDLGNVAIVDLGSASGTINVVLDNLKSGGNYFIKVIQHNTSAVNLNWESKVKWPSGTAPTISTGADAVDGIALTCISSTEVLANYSQDYQ